LLILAILSVLVGGNFSNFVGFGVLVLAIWSVLVCLFYLQYIENQSFAIKKTCSYKIFCKDILTKADFRRKMTLLLPKNGTIGRKRENSPFRE
jgi:hypothetical protein